MRYIVLLPFIFILFSNLTSGQIPLQVGNRWDFLLHQWDASGYSEYDTLQIKITADTLIGNNKYYRITQSPWINDLIRSDSAGIYFYDTLNEKEWLFYKFNLLQGEFISNGYNLSLNDSSVFIKVYKVLEDTVNIWGQRLKRMKYNIIRGVDNAYSISFTNKIGFFDIDVSDFMYNRNFVLMGCKVGDTTYGTLTKIETSKQTPNEYKLYQNYPNPFNPSTTISFVIRHQSFVTLKVYDVLGNEAATLISSELGTGKHEAVWNATSFASGVYYYTLKAGSFISSKKLVLIK